MLCVWDEHGGYNFNKLHFCDENVDYLNLLHGRREFIVIVFEGKNNFVRTDGCE